MTEFSAEQVGRFHSYVMPEPNSGCWLWTGALNGAPGYGVFTLRHHQQIRAHRFSYQWYRGKIPEGLELDHLCRVRCCVNPDHLEAVAHRENSRRGIVGHNNSSKTHCPSGHDYSGTNVTYTSTDRRCKACDRIRHARKTQCQTLA